jgi:hypothetical protein
MAGLTLCLACGTTDPANLDQSTAPLTTDLTNGQVVSNSSGEQFFHLVVPPGQAVLQVQTWATPGGVGDGLRVKFGALPTATDNDGCLAHAKTFQDTDYDNMCHFTNPRAGDWYFRVVGTSPGFNVRAFYGPGYVVASSISVNPGQVLGTTATGTVRLTAAAPNGGAFINGLRNTDFTNVTPRNATVPAGATSVNFPMSGIGPHNPNELFSVTSFFPTPDTLGMARGNFSSGVLPNPQVASVVLSPASVVGGQSTTATVTLVAPAPAGGLVLNTQAAWEFTSEAGVTVPRTVTVPAGATTASFTVQTRVVPVATLSSITAMFGPPGDLQRFSIVSSTLAINPATVVEATAGPALVFASNTVVGGDPVIGAVHMSDDYGSITVWLSASSNVVNLCPSGNCGSQGPFVNIQLGYDNAPFLVTTRSVTTPTQVTITGRFTSTGTGATLATVTKTITVTR